MTPESVVKDWMEHREEIKLKSLWEQNDSLMWQSEQISKEKKKKNKDEYVSRGQAKSVKLMR